MLKVTAKPNIPAKTVNSVLDQLINGFREVSTASFITAGHYTDSKVFTFLQYDVSFFGQPSIWFTKEGLFWGFILTVREYF